MPNHQQHPQEQPQRGAADTNQRFSDRAQQAAEQAKSSALERVRDARAMAESGLDERRQEAAERIRRFGNSLRSTRDLNPDDELVARLFDGASEGAERVASYLAEADFRQMTRDIEGLARDKPAWFVGGAFLAGLAVGRLAKSLASSATEGAWHETRHHAFRSDEQESYELSLDDLENEYPSSVGAGYVPGPGRSGGGGTGAP